MSVDTRNWETPTGEPLRPDAHIAAILNSKHAGQLPEEAQAALRNSLNAAVLGRDIGEIVNE